MEPKTVSKKLGKAEQSNGHGLWDKNKLIIGISDCVDKCWDKGLGNMMGTQRHSGSRVGRNEPKIFKFGTFQT